MRYFGISFLRNYLSDSTEHSCYRVVQLPDSYTKPLSFQLADSAQCCACNNLRLLCIFTHTIHCTSTVYLHAHNPLHVYCVSSRTQSTARPLYIFTHTIHCTSTVYLHAHNPLHVYCVTSRTQSTARLLCNFTHTIHCTSTV